jgi:hypothetical protein
VTNVEKPGWGGVPIRIGSRFLIVLRGKFIASVVLVALEVVAFICFTPDTGLSWIPNVAAIPVGAFLGVAIAPMPVPPNNQTHAEFAVTRLVETIRTVGSAKTSLDQLLADPDQGILRPGAERVSDALARSVSDLVGAASEWDKLEPGVTARTVKEIEKRATLAASLGIKE